LSLTPKLLGKKLLRNDRLHPTLSRSQLGEKLDVAFLEEFLHNYDFEKTDFVYEAGQFAVRGGIIDVFSFANELPCRIELFGSEVDSIRTFEPGSQLSVDALDKINVIPNVQSKLMQEERQSFFDFISPDTRIWVKDFQLTEDIIQKCFEKAESSFDSILKASGAKVVSDPEKLFDKGSSFLAKSSQFVLVEFGNRFILENAKTFDFSASAQPSFNKNFELLAQDLYDHQLKGYGNFITADVPKQTERLKGIFEEIIGELEFQPLDFALRQGFVDNNLKLVCYTDHQIFERFHRYRSKEKFTKTKALTLRELQTLQPVTS
jgi:transcription-repair coupling factor (superfamily II helicase)